MRLPRILAEGEGYYHVTSRIIGREMLLDDGEKERLIETMRSSDAGSGLGWALHPAPLAARSHTTCRTSLRPFTTSFHQIQHSNCARIQSGRAQKHANCQPAPSTPLRPPEITSGEAARYSV